MSTNNLEPRAKIDEVIIAKEYWKGNFVYEKMIQMKVKDAHFDKEWIYKGQDFSQTAYTVKESGILKNLTTNKAYTGNDEQQSPKRFVMANECLIHPGTPGHNC